MEINEDGTISIENAFDLKELLLKFSDAKLKNCSISYNSDNKQSCFVAYSVKIIGTPPQFIILSRG